MRPSTLATCTLIALFSGATLLAVFSRASPTVLGTPRHASVSTHLQPPTLPPIGDFAKVVDTVPDNPFMYNGKPIINEAKDDAGDGPIGSGNPVPPVPPPVRPVPHLNLPAAPALHADAPACHGLLTIGTIRFALVTMPGQPELRQMAVGDTIIATAHGDCWTLIGLEAGNLARWRSPTGNEEIFPIADGVHATIAAASARPGRSMGTAE